MHRLVRIALVLMLIACPASTATAEPQLAVLAPSQGATISGDTVTVEIKVSDFKLVPSRIPTSEAGKRPDANQPGEGMAHLKLDLLPLVILDQQTSYTYTNVPPGEHQLDVELATNDHSLLSPPVVQVVRFSTGMPRVMPATGEARALGADTAGIYLLFTALALIGAGFWLWRTFRRPADSGS